MVAMSNIPSGRRIARLVLKGALPDANQYIAAIGRNRFVGGKMKREATESVAWEARNQIRIPTITTPFFVEFHWHCKNKRKDPDNVAFAKKFILDGLQEAGTISQDTWAMVEGFSDSFHVDAGDERIEVTLYY